MEHISTHIGNRIRLYRKQKNISIEKLGQIIDKSKSTISKYENGEISIDIRTLELIAEALDINLVQILDYKAYKVNKKLKPGGFFSNEGKLFIYYLNNNNNKVISGILETVNNSDDSNTCVFYADVNDYKNLYKCRFLYFGILNYTDNFIYISMQNQDNSAEHIFMNIVNTFGKEETTVGIISGTSAKNLVPISFKMILSKTPIVINEALKSELNLTKEDILEMKRNQCFSVNRYIERADKLDFMY